MSAIDHRFDVCVIGGGAAGAAAAAHLVDAGLDVVLLEQGPRLPDGASYLDAMRAVEPAWAEDGHGRRSPDGYAWTTCNLGGATVFWGGVMWRYREVDFDCRRYLPGADLDVAWPFGYAMLAPFYDVAERDMGVARSLGLDPCEPPTPPAPLAPHPPSPMGAALIEAGLRLGWHPFPTPLAINPVPYGGRGACDRRTLCIERTCPQRARADVVTVYLDPRQDRPNLEIRTRVKARRLVRGHGDRVDAVETIDFRARRIERIRARRFVVACNAIQSAALLLRSRSRRDPAGLGNEHALVGRGLCYKPSVYVRGRRPGRARPTATPSPAHPGPCSTVAFTDHYVDPSMPAGLGGLIYEMAPGPFSEAEPWGPEWLRVECVVADRPSWTNRVYLTEGSNALGRDAVVLRYEIDLVDARRLAALVQRARLLLHAAGAVEVVEEPSGYERGSGHLHGTARAGSDPRGSVVDATGRLHDLSNVWLADGSFMPFPGGLNPTLTILANALRIAAVAAEP